MALIYADRVLETSTTIGTGDFTLAAAVTGYRRFSAVCAIGDVVYYAIIAVDANGVPTGDWETGRGTYSAANTLTRTTVIASSNAGAAVSFAAGSKWAMLTTVSGDYGSSPVVLAQSAVANTITGITTEVTQATIAIPAGLLGLNGRITVLAHWANNNTANNKTMKVKLGATTILSFVGTTTTHNIVEVAISNRNSASSQSHMTRRISSTGTGASAVGTATENTATALNITLTGQLATSTDNLVLESYQVLITPKA